MADLALDPLILAGEGWADYGLVDSGHGRKLERYGPFRFIRPEPQAMWTPRLAEWDADGEFVPGSDEDGGGRWHFFREVPREGWPLEWEEVRFTAQCTPFRHLGFFPDMAPVWHWMRGQLIAPPPAGEGDRPQDGGGGLHSGTPPPSGAGAPATSPDGGGSSTLNLFGYTGVGTLALSKCGPVTHVDASKKSVAAARENAFLSEMQDRPVRWLVDDAAKFTAREVRRGRRYDGIILDPPKFGRGPGGETWRIEEHLAPLIADCRSLLDEDSSFLFLTAYAVRMSSLSLAGLLMEYFAGLPGRIEHGDLAVREDGPDGRLLPTAIFARWTRAE
ncbi:class I SAM-dependent rRNA methyltransferase [Altererythrobacter fulvus]|uniref:class I SAM-dependent rRNA methyltransferase n=1 Tax=Caenibius fulvus TaxID=2126012 RepID=UPI0030190906